MGKILQPRNHDPRDYSIGYGGKLRASLTSGVNCMATRAWRTELASTYASVNPATMMRDVLHEIPEVEQVFVLRDRDSEMSVLIVMDEKKHDAMRRLFAKEAEIVNALPGLQVS